MRVARGTVTVTSHCHYHVVRRQLDTWKIFNFLKKNKKIKIKIQKIQKLTRDTPFNVVIAPLMERV